MIAGLPASVSAQEAPSVINVTPPPGGDQLIEFSADSVAYDSDADVLTASGAVRMSREGNYVAADSIVWTRRTGEVRAVGNVVLMTPEGDKLIGDNVVLTDTLRDGTIDNLLVALEQGGRIAARRGVRRGDTTILENAIYSPCPVTTESGCPKRPSWAITAVRVIDEPAQNRVRFEGGRLQLFGLTLPLLPVFNIPRDQRGGATGWLVPDIAYSSVKGVEIGLPYHWQFGPNRDLTITPHVYTGVLPAVEAKYRQLNSSRRLPARRLPDLRHDRERQLRRPVQPQGHARLFRWQRQVPARPGVEHHHLGPRGQRQDRRPPLRHQLRRPPAKLRQRRADQPE